MNGRFIMKNKSLFIQIIFVIVLAISCLLLTLGIAFLAGSIKVDLFDFKHLNFSNMIPFLLIGSFISCVIIGICILFVCRTAFFKVKDYLNQSDTKKGETKK